MMPMNKTFSVVEMHSGYKRGACLFNRYVLKDDWIMINKFRTVSWKVFLCVI